MKAGLIAFLLALFIGYGPTWSGYYVAWLLGHEQLEVLGDLARFEIPCQSPAMEKSECTHAYLIPQGILAKWGSDAAVGVGRIISATRYSCEGGDGVKVNVDDPSNPGRTFEIFTTYQTLPVSALHCRQGLLIEAWSKKGAVRKGYIGGVAIVGSYLAVERVKKLTEFFTMQLLFVLSVVLGILQVLSRVMMKDASKTESTHPFLIVLPLWLANSLLVSGMFQTLFGLIQVPQLFNRVSMFLTHLSYAILSYLLFFGRSRRPGQDWVTGAVGGLILLYFSSSNAFVHYFQPVNCLLLALYLLAIVKSRQFDQLFMASVIFLAVLKMFALPYLPAEYSVYSFFALAVAFNLVSRIRLNTRVAAFVQWTQSKEWGQGSEQVLETILEKIHDEVGAGRTTLLSVSGEGQVRIQVKAGRKSIHTYVRQELPPLFAHVFSIRDSLIHLRTDSERYRNITRGATASDRYSTEVFSIFPIRAGWRIVGAVAFSEYPDAWVKSTPQTFLLKHLTRTLEPTLAEQIQTNEMRNQSEWTRLLLEAQKQLSTAGSLAEAHRMICTSLGCFGYLASLDEDSRLFTLHAIDGYPKEVERRLRAGRLFAHVENEQGPLAIAANQRKTVIVPDVRLLWQVLHENTRVFFELSGTQSCVAVPIYSGDRKLKNSKLWGILFLERGKGQPFTLEAKAVLEQLASELSGLILRFEQEKVTDEALRMLASFVPERVLDRVMREGLQREEDRGILVMLDLKDSTKIATQVGSEAWLSHARDLAVPLEELALRYGLQWHYFNWDAFYFTLSTALPTQEQLNQIGVFFHEAYPRIQALYREYYSLYGPYQEERAMVARMCVTYGDISRGFLDGATRVWTIVGSEMATMSKLEDLCKRLEGRAFCDESLAPALGSHWSDTQQRVPSTQRRIYRRKPVIQVPDNLPTPSEAA